MKWLVLLLVLAGAGVGGYVYTTQERPVEITAEPVAKGPVEETVASIASGTVMPRQKANVAIGALGTIAEIRVKEGDHVAAGDVLAELDHAELDAQVELAKANLRAGESRLAQARMAENISEEVTGIQVRQAQAQLDAARQEFERVEPLSKREAISKSDFEKAQLALRVAEEAFKAAVASQGETEVRGEDITSATAITEQLQAAVTAAEAMREKAFLRAPFDGVVAKVLLSKGEAVAMGMPVLSLVSDTDLYIEAPFDEANAAEVTKGLPVRIELDAYPDEVFEGVVEYIAPVVMPNADLARTLNVKVEITGDRSKFRSGMSADITVIAQNRDDVVRVPSESLVRDEYAYVIENGRAVRRDVELGIGNWEFQEVLSGVKEGDLIVTSVGVAELADGAMVTVVEELQGS